jgi:DNA polymerase/3'-5' exonuclease PolX
MWRNNPEVEERWSSIQEIIIEIMPIISKFGDAEIVGSIARGCTVPRDIDILLIVNDVKSFNVSLLLVDLGVKYARNDEFKTSFRFKNYLIEIFLASPEFLGSARLYVEGPGVRNIELRKKAQERGMVWKFNGLFKGDVMIKSDDKDVVRNLIEG